MYMVYFGYCSITVMVTISDNLIWNRLLDTRDERLHIAIMADLRPDDLGCPLDLPNL